MRTTEDRAAAVCRSVDPAGWRVILDEAVTRVADRFVRAGPRAAAAQFVEGQLSGIERKTCWPLAERTGHDDPQAMQRLLRTAAWDAAGRLRPDPDLVPGPAHLDQPRQRDFDKTRWVNVEVLETHANKGEY
ncbi:hypothetical protein OG989_27415 [Micromonospora sp. NBC_01740]|uniref:hypothetical protein n=1 Tax=Micromonospora sp. NBC_01740 TaxID=2975986 RepID=UPI002E0D57FC|nr:hypothetical protein OG989_27415 [Micromonospora sp. NBC_01740]